MWWWARGRAHEGPPGSHPGTAAIEVVEVLDRWLAPDHRYFKVRGGDRATYILRHDVKAGAWELVLYTTDERL